MSEKKFCHECGYAMAIDAKVCPECGASASVPETASTAAAAAAPVKDSRAADGPVMGAGTRANIMGSVNTNTNVNTNTVNETHNTNLNQSTTNANIQTSSVDNSSVVNNTTIVMDGKKEPEFCEVCGVPFDGKHARCPKCGKMICFDCKVKGKNRCVECEKKAVNDYRLAFQQLLLTTGGNLGSAGRQMMNQKARELDVEDVKAAIEKELMEEYRPAVKAEQPTVTASTAQAAPTKASEPVGSKGGVVDNREPLRPKNPKSSGGSGKWLVVVLLLVICVGGYFVLSGDESPEPPVTEQPAAPKATPAQQQSAPAVQQQQPAQPVQQPTATPTPAPTTKPVAKPAVKTEVAAPKLDANYEAGMAAYNKGDGLEAISKFKASGSAEANYMLGVIYEKGCGNVAANAMMARSFFKKAAGQGHAEAKGKL